MAGIVDDHEGSAVFQREEEERRMSLLDLLRQVPTAPHSARMPDFRRDARRAES
jgi:hypothetical protein